MEIIMANCYRLLDKKYYIDATTLYKNILARSPNEMMALEGLALILSDEHNNDEALKYFQKVQELDPTNHVVVAGMGWVYALKEDYNKAIEYIKKSLEIAGQDVAEYYYRLGRVYWMTQGKNNNKTMEEMYLIECYRLRIGI
jgi:tetratricopeptide (TPR) repeat protein